MVNTAKATVIASIVGAAAALVVGVLGYIKSGGATTNIINNIANGAQYIIYGSVSNSQIGAANERSGKKLRTAELGYLASEYSMLNGATWETSSAPRDRDLRVSCAIQAVPEGDGPPVASAKFIGDDKKVYCSVTAHNTMASLKVASILNQSHSQHVLPAGRELKLRAEMNQSAAKINSVTLTVYARDER